MKLRQVVLKLVYVIVQAFAWHVHGDGQCWLLSIAAGIVSSKIYDKRDDFNFEIVNFPFLDGDAPRSPSYGVYISQLILFARMCSTTETYF